MNVPEGWYASPTVPNAKEWWDGGAWTGLRSPAPATRSGWFADPVGVGWRWWDGKHWTIYRRSGRDRPGLPIWLSIPVLIAALFFARDLFGVLTYQPQVLPLAAAPVLLMLSAFLWLNQSYPQPRQSRWHAFLWGAVVAGSAAGFINGTVEASFGEQASLVLAAPIGEEVLKGAVIVLAVRRGEIANRLHGAILACWVAAGFTFAEELLYLSFAVDEGTVAETFLFRGLLAGFSHPLFTVWIGLAVGAAVERGHRVEAAAARGLLPAIVLHAMWNGTGDSLLVFMLFVALLALTVGLLIQQRGVLAREHDLTAAAIVRAAGTARIPGYRIDTLKPFLSSTATRSARRALDRPLRPQFDTAHAAVMRAFTDAQRSASVTRRELTEIMEYAGRASVSVKQPRL